MAQPDARLGYHREGMGSHKLPLILPLAKRDPASSLWLYTFQQMVVAKCFYERHGFTAVEFGFEPNWQLADVKYQWVKGVIGAFDR